eukprot:TRINITY_DN2461_c1_g3_i1.p1 TRINITY_DN2461_c1_g3~~TRINITY_DN2461_c1_g3_i1.p1  ORF type:complete len:263 (+),score=69.56 TRINITY_DN2461_c1_g3_i1:62-790(+)
MVNVGSFSYNLGRVELLNWVNITLKTGFKKIEDTFTCAPYCQLIDSIYPGTVPMARLNWNAKADFERVNNLKILQQAFQKNDIDRAIDVARVSKGRLMDNLEVLQYIYVLFDRVGGAFENYNPIERRAYGKSHPISNVNPQKLTSTTMQGQSIRRRTQPMAKGSRKSGLIDLNPSPLRPAKQLQQQLAQSNLERDFYRNKLRKIELLVEYNDADLAKQIKDILFASDGYNVVYPNEVPTEVF